MTDTTQPASGVSEEMLARIEARVESLANGYKGVLPWGDPKSRDTLGREAHIVDTLKAFRADMDELRVALSAKPAHTEQIASVRICVEWAISQLNCGNMSKDEFFDYLVSLFGTISAHETVRDMQERWRRDKSERDHLRYVLSREPAQGEEDRHIRLLWRYAELAKIVLRITGAYRKNWRDNLKFAVADAEDFLKPDPDREALLTPDEEEEALAYMDNPPQPIPTPDEAIQNVINAWDYWVDKRFAENNEGDSFATLTAAMRNLAAMSSVAALSRARPK
jgi:hypothetical protein